MATIQIRDVPDDVYEILRAEAREAGQSLQSYMRGWIVDGARVMARKKAMLAEVRAVMAADRGAGVTTEDILAALDEDRH